MTQTDEGGAQFGSDVTADLLRTLGVPYLAINPGASFRGLHDSIVNHLGNHEPRLILTLHEAQAVAIAHGYAKVCGKPMGVVLHANIGLMNAVMSIYNAWADRVPMLILGATGAVDASRRRPWIEWIHTSRDQAALVRPFVKWDDQPASVPAMVESILRAWGLTQSEPCGPTYICLDVDLQESGSTHRATIDPARYIPRARPSINETDLKRAQQIIQKAQKPLLLVGRHTRTQDAWDARITFAEGVGAAVICDQKVGVGFPSTHPLFISAPAQYPSKRTCALMAEADLIISLDWPDLKGMLSVRPDKGSGLATIIVSQDEQLHNGWSLDHFALAEADMRLSVSPETFVAAMNAMPGARAPGKWMIAPPTRPDLPQSGPVTIPALIASFEACRGQRKICLTRLTFGAPDEFIQFTGPLDCIGMDGGAGIGSTPGITVGAALALKGTGRIPVAIIGDGDLLMGSQALWTAAHEKLPCLFIVNNNSSFYNDVEHQEIVARRRTRPVENKNIGMEITDPNINIAELAHSYGFVVYGPVSKIEELATIFEAAFQSVESGACVLVDVVTLPPAPRG